MARDRRVGDGWRGKEDWQAPSHGRGERAKRLARCSGKGRVTVWHNGVIVGVNIFAKLLEYTKYNVGFFEGK